VTNDRDELITLRSEKREKGFEDRGERREREGVRESCSIELLSSDSCCNEDVIKRQPMIYAQRQQPTATGTLTLGAPKVVIL